jgi:hypothetical protein
VGASEWGIYYLNLTATGSVIVIESPAHQTNRLVADGYFETAGRLRCRGISGIASLIRIDRSGADMNRRDRCRRHVANSGVRRAEEDGSVTLRLPSQQRQTAAASPPEHAGVDIAAAPPNRP